MTIVLFPFLSYFHPFPPLSPSSPLPLLSPMASNIYRHVRFGTVLISWMIFHSEETTSPLSKGQIVVLWAQ